MCGIFGYIGTKSNAAEIVFEGLKLLEYRGYDSWGIAVKSGSKLQIEKHVGKIGKAQSVLPSATIGIGHTRWATHGAVTELNAHPHTDCTEQLAVIHNGIVENFQEIKDELLKKGHTFKSGTDTEVIAHLIEENLKKEAFSSAVKNAFNRLKGMNAIVVLNSESKEIIAAKNGSPLIAGIGEDGYYLASDASGVIKHTKNVIFLEDNQMIILGKDLKLLSLPGGKELIPQIQKLTWEFEEAELGKFNHFLLKEIFEQPKVINHVAFNLSTDIEKLAERIEKAFGTFMLGCGTASYAALAGTYLFSGIAKKHVNFSTGSEFNYLEDYLTPESLVIPISQSGETIDIIESIINAKKRGSKIAAIVNVLGSTLYRQADYKILLGAGPEKAVIATKSFIAMISVLLYTAYVLSGRKEEGRKLLLSAAKDITDLLNEKYLQSIRETAKILKRKEHVFVIGRGLSYATALEATLKLKETCYIHAEGFAGGELKHGVIALIEESTPCIVMAPNDETFDAIISNAQEVKARGAYIIGIGPNYNNVFDVYHKTDDLKEATMLSQVVVSQLLAYYLALEKGIEDPDKPRNLAKSVTVK